MGVIIREVTYKEENTMVVPRGVIADKRRHCERSAAIFSLSVSFCSQGIAAQGTDEGTNEFQFFVFLAQSPWPWGSLTLTGRF